MATEQDVELVIADLLDRIGDVEEPRRTRLPSYRLVEIRCPDLDLVRQAEWRSGRATVLPGVPTEAADIRIEVASDDLVRLATGELSFARAYASKQLRIHASITDLLRLRAVL